MPELPYQVTIEGEGTRIERRIDQHQLLRVLSVVLGTGGGGVAESGALGGASGPSPSAGSASATAVSARGRQGDQTIGEFLSGCNAGSNAERIAGIAMYLQEYLGDESVSKDALPTWFRKAGLPIPKNLPRDLAAAVKKNLIAEEHDQDGLYYVTGTGKHHLRGRDWDS